MSQTSCIPDRDGPSPPSRVRVFAHLAHGFDADLWRRRHASGELVGVNDPTPYGYGRAEAKGCRVTFSKDAPEGRFGRLLRLGLRAVLGFDFLHAWRNRAGIRASEVVWTHTESQFLAVALVILLSGSRGEGPKLLGQSVWLFDRWERLSGLRRLFYRLLIARVDVLTVHSPENERVARAAFPDRWVELVLYGIPEGDKRPPRLRSDCPIRVLSVGNDEHRDWATVVEALRDRPNIVLDIISARAPARLAESSSNVTIRRVSNNDELLAAYEAASLVVVPLKPNRHASGITVIQEATLRGLPVVATRTGGLEAYFGPDAVGFVPPNDPDALRAAVEALGGDPAAATAQAQRAQALMAPGRLGCESFVDRHVELTRRLLAT